MHTATAIAHPNIAFVKYWGNRDQALRLPANGSISMNLAELETRTQVTFDPALTADTLVLNGRPSYGPALGRVTAMLDRVRQLSGLRLRAAVTSHNNFPMGAGIASSAAAFAALAVASCAAAGLQLPEPELSRLARRGSGSACRSVPGGFVEWQAGRNDSDSYAYSIAPPDHWELVDCVAVVSQAHKPTGSTEGHALADTSPLQRARVADAPRRLGMCRQAILERDFAAFALIVEQDSHLMHAVMMTSAPALLYWQPATVAVMQAVQEWRRGGLPACFTIDAGPNVHVLCEGSAAAQVEKRLREVPGVGQVLVAHPGGAAGMLAAHIN
jgi:diphosphomevalonate decarboxylase